jgi:CheY-like chemotaxis protein
MMLTRTALVVDDDPVSRVVLSHMLRQLGWHVAKVDDSPEAISKLRGKGYDLVLCDYCLPTGTGMDVLEAAENAEARPTFVLVTGKIELSSSAPEITSRVAAQLTKPVGTDALRDTLERLFPSASA